MRLRTRLLLHKQDRLAVLEKELDRVDRQETKSLFLGNLRRDKNSDRRQLIEQIDAALSEYGELGALRSPSCSFRNGPSCSSFTVYWAVVDEQQTMTDKKTR